VVTRRLDTSQSRSRSSPLCLAQVNARMAGRVARRRAKASAMVSLMGFPCEPWNGFSGAPLGGLTQQLPMMLVILHGSAGVTCRSCRTPSVITVDSVSRGTRPITGLQGIRGIVPLSVIPVVQDGIVRVSSGSNSPELELWSQTRPADRSREKLESSGVGGKEERSVSPPASPACATKEPNDSHTGNTISMRQAPSSLNLRNIANFIHLCFPLLRAVI
jgi:hypothetical protein